MTVYVTSGEWIVKSGEEEAFFEAWTATKNLEPPLQGVITPPRLLRDLDTAGRFVSFAEFDSLDATTEFRSRPDFGALTGAVREHLDDMRIYTFEQVIAP